MDGDFICMLRELRCLRWRKMPFHHIPMGLKTSHLISLDFSGSTNLASLWTESNENVKVRSLYKIPKYLVSLC